MSGIMMNPPRRDLESFGCSVEQWRELRDLGNEMIKQGLGKECTPLRAYSHQRSCAVGKRKIEWKLTLPEWWAIWRDSGHWHERGIGRGYMMCRIGDKGAYEVGNVFIGPGVENLSAAAKKSSLPIGVARCAKGKVKPYRAYCNVGGKQRHIGVFATVDEARAAYLAALEIDLAMKRAA
jgi:hypothetical protein